MLDVVVVGAGFGGLGAALSLAEQGAKVALLERLDYPGGCASTFRRSGYRFEAGATLFSGFGPGQLFERWIARHALPVTVDHLDPVVSLRSPHVTLDVPADRDALIAKFCALPGAPVDRLRAFFAEQAKVADVLWSVLDDPALLPPFGLATFARHASQLARYAPLARWIGRPVSSVLRAFELDGFAPLRTFIDALAQITVQCGVAEAEAPFALATMDYYFRGTGHVRNGIGALASALAGAVKGLGGDVRFTSGVKGLARTKDGWHVHARGGDLDARFVVLNLVPGAVPSLLSADDAARASARLGPLEEDLEDGWGACMLYLVVEPDASLATAPHHVEIVVDPAAPLVEGNHLFASLSGPRDEGRAPEGLRTLTVSTHVRMRELLALDEATRGARVAEIQAKMFEALRTFAPDLVRRTVHTMTASPRTFERFTGRTHGLVGGIPRRAGLHNYRRILPVEPLPALFLTGDTVFPGQSTLATALGGVKVADRIRARL